jgi:CheY-like chemotaxis protein
MRILFVDDDQRRMDKYVLVLEARGHEVVFADNVDSALAMIRSKEDFDLAVVDISMPPGDEYRFEDTVGGTRTGLALYDTIRAERPKLPVVMLTNVPDPRVVTHFARDSERLWRLVRKPDALPVQFAALIEKFLTAEDPDGDSSR